MVLQKCVHQSDKAKINCGENKDFDDLFLTA